MAKENKEKKDVMTMWHRRVAIAKMKGMTLCVFFKLADTDLEKKLEFVIEYCLTLSLHKVPLEPCQKIGIKGSIPAPFRNTTLQLQK